MIDSAENLALRNLEGALPYLSEFFEGEASFLITNKNSIIKVLASDSKRNISPFNEGDTVPKDSCFSKCMEQGKAIHCTINIP